jgi:hypothetical protein
VDEVKGGARLGPEFGVSLSIPDAAPSLSPSRLLRLPGCWRTLRQDWHANPAPGPGPLCPRSEDEGDLHWLCASTPVLTPLLVVSRRRAWLTLLSCAASVLGLGLLVGRRLGP